MLPPPEVIVERLASVTPADRLAKALTAYGGIVKTIYVLRYIQDEKLRRAVQMQLNGGEARHSLARWLFFANRGEFRDGDLNEIMNRTRCLSLLCNAAVVWNTVRMQKIVNQLRGSEQTVRDEDLARVWPLLHEHILPNGMDMLSSLGPAPEKRPAFSGRTEALPPHGGARRSEECARESSDSAAPISWI